MPVKGNQFLGLIVFACLILFWVNVPFIEGRAIGSLALLLLGIYLLIK